LVVDGACRPKKEAPFEESFATSLHKYGLPVPDASGATVPIPKDGIVVIFYRNHLNLDTAPRIASYADLPLPADSGLGDVVLSFDPTRAAMAGADAKSERSPGDSLIVPLANAISSDLERGVAKRMIVVSLGPPPRQLFDDVVATFASMGVTEGFRIVRGRDGRVVAERLP